MKRGEHLFEFTGARIASAAGVEAEYHRDRVSYWELRAAKALATVEATISARVVRRQVTDGEEVDVVVDYGDAEAWREYQLATRKTRAHGEARDRFLEDETTYGTQPLRTYQLDRDDVRHYRLGGEPRED